jgi:N6-L-threonylcarbamoyladenine synthase
MAYKQYSPASVVIAGGVAASQPLRDQLRAKLPIEIVYAEKSLCTDNAAMIASLGYFKATRGNNDSVSPHDVRINPSLAM